MRMASSTFLFFLCGEICCQVENTTITWPAETTTSAATWPSETTTTASVETTISSLYCAADKCDRHSLFIYDLEQKVNNLTRGFEILQNQVEILTDDNERITSDLEVLEEENLELKRENEILRENVKELQVLGYNLFLTCQCMR